MSDGQHAGWVSTTLGDACEINPPKPKLAGVPDDHPVLFVPMAAVDDITGTIVEPERRTLGEVRTKSYRTFRSGDVLFAKITPCMENGKSAIVPEIDNDLGFGSTEFHVLRPKPQTSARFIWHLVRQERFRREAEENMTGSVGQARVPAGYLDSYLFYLPPLDEQEHIADRLDSAAETASRATANLTTARSTMTAFRQSVLAAACAGWLTVDWREEHPCTAETSEHLVRRSRQLLGIPERLMLDGRAADEVTQMDIPESWTWSPLSSLAAIRGGLQKQPKRTPRSNAFPYLRVANVLRGRLSLRELARFELFDGELQTYRLKPGDMLVVEGNGSASEIERSALWNGEIPDCVHQNHIIRVRCVAMNPRFVDLFWNSPVGSSEIAALAVTSSGLYSLSTKKIGAVLVPVPPLVEQDAIVDRVHELLQRVGFIAYHVDRTLSMVEHAYASVMNRTLARPRPPG